jgi:hypothetical protein
MFDTAEYHKATEGAKQNECTVLHFSSIKGHELLVICACCEAKQQKLHRKELQTLTWFITSINVYNRSHGTLLE